MAALLGPAPGLAQQSRTYKESFQVSENKRAASQILTARIARRIQQHAANQCVLTRPSS